MIHVLLTFRINNVRIQENQLTAFCRLTQEIHKTYILDSIRRGTQVNCEKTWKGMTNALARRKTHTKQRAFSQNHYTVSNVINDIKNILSTLHSTGDVSSKD